VAQRNGLVQAVGAELGLLKNISDSTDGRVCAAMAPAAATWRWPSSGATRFEAICAGRDITAITQVRGSGMIYGLQAGLPVVAPPGAVCTGWRRWRSGWPP
jgi:hypothetical protein